MASFVFIRCLMSVQCSRRNVSSQLATAWHLFVWYRDNQFCGRCGKKLVHSEMQRMLCSVRLCANMVFPKIAPAVIVGVTHGDKILMTKYAGREYKRYALIAGFTEIGETAERRSKRSHGGSRAYREEYPLL